MDKEANTIEETLKGMKPSSLSDPLLDRLTLAMDTAGKAEGGSGKKVVYATLDNELAEIEATLRELVPHGMPENMIGRLDDAMSRWHEKVPVEEKVVPMIPRTEKPTRSLRPGWRSAAAVALMGAGAAFLGSGDSPSASKTASRKVPVNPVASQPAVFTPGEARSSVVSANDHGVLWAGEDLPVRCFEVEVNKEVSFVNERGERLTISQPQREWMFTPVKVD